MKTLIKNATIVNEGEQYKGAVYIKEGKIAKIIRGEIKQNIEVDRIIDATSLFLLPGVIDDQVHFREPGITYKGDIYSESKAAVAGGITSFMEMPNTKPPVLTQQLLEEKYLLASEKSLANYSFYMGASNDNIAEVLKTPIANVCGVKIFMGSSTGNMLVDNRETLEQLFSNCKLPIAVHCEDETTILANVKKYKNQYGDNVPIECHPKIRSEEACYLSSSLAVEIAKKHETRLHLLHLSTAKELELLDNITALKDKRITAEVCVHHLWFCDEDYKAKGTLIKWNPAIKTKKDRDALLQAVNDNRIDVIATDHAPHTLEEKQNTYFNAPSGGPLVQHSLIAMMELYQKGKITLEKIVEKMCHAPADCFQVDKRGYIKEGYWGDIVLIDPSSPNTVDTSNILYKCGWSPFEGETFQSKVTHTFVNGNLVYDNGTWDEEEKGRRLEFDRIM